MDFFSIPFNKFLIAHVLLKPNLALLSGILVTLKLRNWKGMEGYVMETFESLQKSSVNVGKPWKIIFGKSSATLPKVFGNLRKILEKCSGMFVVRLQ